MILYLVADSGLRTLQVRKYIDFKLNILLSYHYFKNKNLDKLLYETFKLNLSNVFFDSGAFSAHTQGVEIYIDDYIEYINKYKHLFTVYSNLDVIRDFKSTYKNQLIMEQSGLNPLPVFHAGSPFTELERLCEKYDYIALGGMVSFHIKKRMPFLIKSFKIAKKYNTKYHGFGCTTYKILKSLPFFSVDSSSSTSGVRYGNLTFFEEKYGKFSQAKLGDIKSCKQHAEYFRELGFSWVDFANRDANEHNKIYAISIHNYKKIERYISRLHRQMK